MAKRPHNGKVVCCECGKKTYEWSHNMLGCMTHGLKKLAAHGPGNLQQIGLDDDVTVYTNFCKLKWWGLMRHVTPDGDDWEITPKGLRFLAGKLTIPRTVWTYNNQPLEFAGDLVGINDIDEWVRRKKDYLGP